MVTHGLAARRHSCVHRITVEKKEHGMRKILVIVAAALAGLAVVPQAQAHDDRVGVFIVGAVTGAVVGHVLASHDDDRYYERRPRVVEHHYYEAPRRRSREIHNHYYKQPR